MKGAAHAGICISDFWEMTPAELAIYITAFGERVKRDYEHQHNTAVMMAYLASRWVWSKNVNAKKFLAQKTEKQNSEDTTDSEMFNAVKAWNAIFNTQQPD